MFTNRGFAMIPEVLRRDVNNWFSDVFENTGLQTRTFPALNVWEDNDVLHAEAELPGVSMEDIEVMVVGNELTIRGQRRQQATDKVNFHRRERGTGEFSRTVTLPFDIDQNRVEATLKNGILTIVMPKAETAKPRKIQVRA
jgi:HSP20 family protein